MSDFHQNRRSAVDPRLPLETRRKALTACLYRLAYITRHFGSEVRSHHKAYRTRIGIEDFDSATGDQIIVAILLADVEFNKLREVQRLIETRNLRRRIRGRRQNTQAEVEADHALWNHAIARYKQNLKG